MFNKITNEDLEDRGVMGLPATPELSVSELQRKFDEVGKEVIVPKFNAMIEQLNSNVASESLGAKPTSNMHGVGNTVQSILQALDDMIHNLYMGASFSVDATTGHLVVKYPDGSTGDLGQIAFSPKGEWKDDVDYDVMSVVFYGSVSYVAIQNVPAGTPVTDTEYWVKSADTNQSVEMLKTTKADKTYVDNNVSDINTQIGNVNSNLATEVSARTQADSAVNARIDNLVIGAGGTSPIEVTDAHVGADGLTYDSLKSRLDFEHNKVNNKLHEIYPTAKSNNLFNKGEVVFGKYYDEHGNYVDANNWYATELEPCEPNTTYSKGYGAIAEFDADRHFLKYHYLDERTFTTEADGYYFGICGQIPYLDTMRYNKGNSLLPYEPFWERIDASKSMV